MDRRRFLKQVVATAMVRAVAPKLVTIGVDTAMAGATSRVAIGGTRYEIALAEEIEAQERMALMWRSLGDTGNEAAIQRTIARLKGYNCP